MAMYNNPIAYYKRAQSQNVDALNRVAVCATGTTAYNGTLVTLGQMNTGAALGMNYVFPATVTAADTAVDVWMVRAPEVPMSVLTNQFDDPRAFEVPAGTPFDIMRPMPGDIIHLSDTAFGANQKPDSSNMWVTPTANGQYIAIASAAGKTGLVLKLQSTEPIIVGQDMVTGYVLEVAQNPNQALS